MELEKARQLFRELPIGEVFDYRGESFIKVSECIAEPVSGPITLNPDEEVYVLTDEEVAELEGVEE